MHWESDYQKSRAIRRLLAVAFRRVHQVDAWWTEYGPTQRALHFAMEPGSDVFTDEETLMMRIAFDFWNGKGGVSFVEVIEMFDQTHLEAVLSLAQARARGPWTVEAWIKQKDEERELRERDTDPPSKPPPRR